MPFIAVEQPELTVSENLKSDLKEKLELLKTRFNDYETAKNALEKCVRLRADRNYFESLLSDCIKSWLSDLCANVNMNTANRSHVKITLKDLPDEVTDFDVDYQKTTPGEMIEYTLKNFNFGLLVDTLEKQSNTVESKGFSDAALYLAREFGLIQTCGEREIKIKPVKGRYPLSVSNYSDHNFQRIEKFTHLKKLADTFEIEAGVDGLAACFYALGLEEKRVDFAAMTSITEPRVASRTKVTTGSPVEGEFFKSKVKLYLKPEVFEALIGFIKAHIKTDRELKTIIAQ